jgi:hypothetical protein
MVLETRATGAHTCRSATANRNCSSPTSVPSSEPPSPTEMSPSPLAAAEDFAAATLDARRGDTPNAAGLFPRRSAALTPTLESLLRLKPLRFSVLLVGNWELSGSGRLARLPGRFPDGVVPMEWLLV